jgi:Putative transposase
MNEGAANLVDHVLPEKVPIRQWVLTLPYPLRYPLAFNAGHLGHVLHLFTDTVRKWYCRSRSAGQTGSVTVIQRASSDLRLNPHFHTLFLDGVYEPMPLGSNRVDSVPSPPLVFHPTPKPTQADIESVVERARERILRYLQKRSLITFATAPGDDEVNAVLEEGFGESDPAHATLLAAATAGHPPAGPAQRRKPLFMPLAVETGPEPKGYLCAQIGGFNLHAARRVAPNDKQGREMLCRYILRPPLANERIRLMPDGSVTVEFKRPWSDGTRSIGLEPKALISRLAAIVPPPRRHVTVYSGVLASNSKWRQFVIPKQVETAASARELGRGSDAGCEGDAEAQDASALPGAGGQLLASHHQQAKPKTQVPFKSSSGHYIPWHELLRRTFGEEVRCPSCGGRLRLVAMVKTEATIREILIAMHLPQSSTGPPKQETRQSLEPEAIELDWGDGGSGEANICETVDWPEYPD